MPSLLSTPARRMLMAWLAAILLVAAAVPVGAGGPPGNNGTVKIHSGATLDDDTAPVVANEPHVTCPFHAHFFFGDQPQPDVAGPDWTIEGWSPTGDGVAASGNFISLGNGEYWSGAISDLGTADTAHFKLFWVGRTAQNIMHKTFWASGCGEGGGNGG